MDIETIGGESQDSY